MIVIVITDTVIVEALASIYDVLKRNYEMNRTDERSNEVQCVIVVASLEGGSHNDAAFWMLEGFSAVVYRVW